MIASLNILDNFFPEPETVRQYALSHDFTQAPVYDGHTYPGFAPVKDHRFVELLEAQLADAIGGKIKVNMAMFVAGTEDHKLVQWIHADNSCAAFAGVLYLFDKPGHGTAFWKANGVTGSLREMTESVKSGGAENWPDIVVNLLKSYSETDSWIRTDYADSGFNRLIFYPTDRFHSRWPEQAFGDAPANCRLTLAFFFDLE